MLEEADVKEEKLNYWNQQLLNLKGQIMTIYFMGGQVITDVEIKQVDFVKGLIYFRPNRGRGALSTVPWNAAVLCGEDHDPRLEKVDISKLAEATD